MEQHYLWQGRASIVTCSGSTHQNVMPLQSDTPYVPRKVFPEAQDIPRHGSGDLLEDRFGFDVMRWHILAQRQHRKLREGMESQRMYHKESKVWELCEFFPAVTRLTVYRRPSVLHRLICCFFKRQVSHISLTANPSSQQSCNFGCNDS